MDQITKQELSRIKDKEFTILFIQAKGCKFCETAKPMVLNYEKLYPNIQFLSIDLAEANEYYTKYATKEPKISYEVMKDPSGEELKDDNGNAITMAIPELNEDGSPKMSVKYSIPSFYVHHIAAQSEDNEYGWIGEFVGSSEAELSTICQQITNYR